MNLSVGYGSIYEQANRNSFNHRVEWVIFVCPETNGGKRKSSASPDKSIRPELARAGGSKGEVTMTTTERTIQIIRETWNNNVRRFTAELGIKEPALNINLAIPAIVMAQTDFKWKHDGVKYIELVSNNAIYVFNVYVQFIQQLPEEAQRQITIAVLSHELRHCYQLVHENRKMLDDFNTGANFTGANQTQYVQRWSEVDANAFSAMKVSPTVMDTVMLIQTCNTQKDLKRIFKLTKAIKKAVKH